MLVGLGEAPLLLPLDTIKIRMQTNSTTLKGSFINILMNERAKLYNGLSWTMGRNLIGSGMLFSAHAALKEYCFTAQIDEKTGKETYSVGQRVISSSAASAASIATTNPLDVVKTRIQSGKWGDMKGMRIARETLYSEGTSAFFKGTGTKILTAGPKVAFALMAAESIAEIITNKMR